eukprot:m.77927 g.77927  ORF g.77927 m.77927 type:complete len:179 (+) comp8149_c0_seq2:1580-2116(+)
MSCLAAHHQQQQQLKRGADAFEAHEAQLPKRTRLAPPPQHYVAQQHQPQQAQQHQPHPQMHLRPRDPHSPFVPKSPAPSSDDFLPQAKRRRTRRCANADDEAADMGVPGRHSNAEQCFSRDQVAALIQQAMREREITLADEYNQILQEKLMEQQQIFERYVADQIHGRMAESPFCYTN